MLDAERQALIESLPLAFVEIDRAGRICAWNRAFLDMTGAAPASVAGSLLLDITSPTPETEALLRAAKREVFELGRTFSGEGVGLGAGARRVVFRSHVSPVRDAAGAVAGARILTEDVTAFRALEAQLAASEQGYRDLFENAPVAYLEFSSVENGQRITRWNRRAAELIDRSEEELRAGVFGAELISPRHAADVVSSVVRRTYANRAQSVVDVPLLRRDGSIAWARTVTAPVVDPSGAVVGTRSISEDVTALHAAQAALAASEAELRDLYDNAPLAYFLVDREFRLVRWNGRVPEFFGVAPEEFRVGRPIRELIRPTPESEARMAATVEAIFGRGEPFSDELRFTRLDGAVRVIRSSSRPARNERGEVIAIATLTEDITETRRAEQAARESDAQVRTVFEGAADGIAALDANGTIVMLNAAAGRMLRIAPAEAVGQSMERFILPGNLAPLHDAMFTLLKTGARRPAYSPPGTRVLRADGSSFESESTVSLAAAGGKPLFLIIFRDIEERRALERESEALRAQAEQLQEEIKQTHDFESIVGQSRALSSTLEQVARVAPTLSTVLILGETGTGKELIARAIHARSPRSTQPLVKVNCAALPAGLIESELFGHERGSFTGATERRVGRFELADGGTLFLDEVGELPLETQAKLLRALQEREFERVGSAQTRKTDVRLIAATNRDLKALADEGGFRTDLYYRLHVFPVSLPPLRERGDDILLLARFFLERFAAKLGRSIARIEPDTAARLLAYAWPGNVRELENVIERAVILETSDALRIAPAMLPAPTPEPMRTGAAPAPPIAFARAAASALANAASTPPPSPLTLEETQRRAIVAALEAASWRVAGPRGAAAALGVRESTLRSQMQRFGITRPR
jgi:PAS domain S-box-containing protein